MPCPFRAKPNLPVERLDFAKLARLDFEAPDEVRFPALRLARLAMMRGGVQGAVLNGAKEVALEAFIEGRLSFLAMAEVTERVMDDLVNLPPYVCGMDDVFAADREARQRAAELMTLAIAE